MKIAIVGQGYVGLTISIGALSAGHEVIGIDHSEDLVLRLKRGLSHIEGIKDSEISVAVSTGKYKPSNDFSNISESDIVVVAVPTPLDDFGKPDLHLLKSASESIGKSLKKRQLIINESTSFPGTVREVIKPIVEKFSPLEHLYAISPERVDPGNKNFGTRNTPRIVGGLTDVARDKAVEFYRSFCDYVVPVSSPEVAEAAKLFENTFRFINIGLVNEFAQIMGAMGIPVDEVLSAAATKPYGFMPFHPNVGIGGHCIPVDPLYLQQKAKEIGIESKYIAISEAVNHEMPQFIVGRLRSELGGLSGKRIQLAGVSYKANIADTRETPAIEVMKLLEGEGVEVSWHDPLVTSWNGRVSSDLDSSVDAGLVLVAHDGFDLSGWGSVPVYSINRHPVHPWTPLITVKPKF